MDKSDINPWYYLDADNRKDDPKTGIYCSRCKKKNGNII